MLEVGSVGHVLCGYLEETTRRVDEKRCTAVVSCEYVALLWKIVIEERTSRDDKNKCTVVASCECDPGLIVVENNDTIGHEKRCTLVLQM